MVLELGWHKKGSPEETGQRVRAPKRRLWARGSMSKGAGQEGPDLGGPVTGSATASPWPMGPAAPARG